MESGYSKKDKLLIGISIAFLIGVIIFLIYFYHYSKDKQNNKPADTTKNEEITIRLFDYQAMYNNYINNISNKIYNKSASINIDDDLKLEIENGKLISKGKINAVISGIENNVNSISFTDTETNYMIVLTTTNKEIYYYESDFGSLDDVTSVNITFKKMDNSSADYLTSQECLRVFDATALYCKIYAVKDNKYYEIKYSNDEKLYVSGESSEVGKLIYSYSGNCEIYVEITGVSLGNENNKYKLKYNEKELTISYILYNAYNNRIIFIDKDNDVYYVDSENLNIKDNYVTTTKINKSKVKSVNYDKKDCKDGLCEICSTDKNVNINDMVIYEDNANLDFYKYFE